MAIEQLPGGGGWYDTVTGQLLAYDPTASSIYTVGGTPLLSSLPLVPPLGPPLPSGGLAYVGGALNPPSATAGYPQYAAYSGGSMPAVISLSTVLRVLSFLAVAVPAIREFVDKAIPGTQLSLDSLPSWVKPVLIGAGLLAAGAGAAYLIWDLTHDGVGGGGQVPTGFVPAWNANGVQFYRRQDGMLGVMNLKGHWKQWRPKKPIVLYSTGATNLKTFLRAGKALTRQARELRTVIERQAGGAPARRERQHLIPESQAIRMIEAATK